MKKLKDEVMDKLIDEMTRDNKGKPPLLIGGNGFRSELTKKNWKKLVAENKKCVENYLKKKKSA